MGDATRDFTIVLRNGSDLSLLAGDGGTGILRDWSYDLGDNNFAGVERVRAVATIDYQLPGYPGPALRVRSGEALRRSPVGVEVGIEIAAIETDVVTTDGTPGDMATRTVIGLVDDDAGVFYGSGGNGIHVELSTVLGTLRTGTLAIRAADFGVLLDPVALPDWDGTTPITVTLRTTSDGWHLRASERFSDNTMGRSRGLRGGVRRTAERGTMDLFLASRMFGAGWSSTSSLAPSASNAPEERPWPSLRRATRRRPRGSPTTRSSHRPRGRCGRGKARG